MNTSDRKRGVKLIIQLHKSKEYKIEILFLAVGIFDRYIKAIGIDKFAKNKIICLATVSLLLAAKMEDPLQPSFIRMIEKLPQQYKHLVTLNKLQDMEMDVLMVLGFDFSFPGPILPMDRYLRILDYDDNKLVS